MKFLARAWKDSRAVVYGFVFAFATGLYSFIHVHGTPKTHADWTVLGWAAAGIAFSALVRAADPYLAKIVTAGAKVAFKGGVVLSPDEVSKIVKAALAEQAIASGALNAKLAEAASPEPVAVVEPPPPATPIPAV